MTEKQKVQSEEKHSRLPADRAFVLQFRTEADVQHGQFDGRIEHVVSGQTALFHSLEELVEFLSHVLPSRRSE
jgi:hypothetical protein